MVNLFYGDMKPPNQEGRSAAESEGVLVGTASPVQLAVRVAEHHLTPPESVCIATFHNGRQISRCAVPSETADEFLSMELFEKPVSLAINARAGDPGVEGNLLALVPLSPRESEEDTTPWRNSVPGAAYDAVRDEGDEKQHLVGIFLGQVVRFKEDRRFPDSLSREAADMLGGVVRGRIGKLVDRVIRHLSEQGS